MEFKQICLKLSEKMWPNKFMKQFGKHRKIAYVMKLNCTNTEHIFVVIRVCNLHTNFNCRRKSKYKQANDMGTSTLWNASNWVTFRTESFQRCEKMQNMTTYCLFEKRTEGVQLQGARRRSRKVPSIAWKILWLSNGQVEVFPMSDST